MAACLTLRTWPGTSNSVTNSTRNSAHHLCSAAAIKRALQFAKRVIMNRTSILHTVFSHILGIIKRLHHMNATGTFDKRPSLVTTRRQLLELFSDIKLTEF